MRDLPHLEVTRIGNTVVARTDLGRDERVVLAGHIDTVPLTVDPVNLPTRRVDSAGGEVLWGRGTVDMKGGVAVMLRVAHEVPEPSRDVTFVFYEGEEIDSAVQRAAPRRAAAPRPHRRRRLRRAPRAHRRPGRGRLQGHPARRGLDQGHRRALGPAVEGAQRHPRRRRGARPARRLRAGHRVVDGLEFREALNAVLIDGGIATNVIPDRCVVTVNYRYAPVAVGGRGRGPRAPGASPASRSRSSTTPAAPGPGCTCPRPRPSSRRSACRSRPSRAGPTSRASRRWGCRRQLRPRRPEPRPHGRRAVPGRAVRRVRGRPAPLARLTPEPRAAAHAGYSGAVDPHPEPAAARPTVTTTRARSSCAARRCPARRPTQRLLDSRGSADWLHTDPWRVMRIQSEFVTGFGALAEVGPAVSVFGSARTRPDHPDLRARRPGRRRTGRGRLRGHHRRRPGRDGGREPRCPRGRRHVGRPRHRAALRGRAQRVRRPRRQLPLLLRAQDDVRQVRPGLRRAARRLRHPRRALRGGDAGADPEGHAASRSCCSGPSYWGGLLDWLRGTAADGGHDQRCATSPCSPSPTTSTRRSRRSSPPRPRRRPRGRAAAPPAPRARPSRDAPRVARPATVGSAPWSRSSSSCSSPSRSSRRCSAWRAAGCAVDPLAEAVHTTPDPGLPERPQAADVDAVRFDTALRGYRMDDVDAAARGAARRPRRARAHRGRLRAERPADDPESG